MARLDWDRAARRDMTADAAAQARAARRLALAVTLPSYVRMEIRSQRNQMQPGTIRRAPTSARWDGVAQLHATGELALLRARVFASGEWKFLGDCSRDDVTDLAEQRAAEAEANAAAAERFKQLRAAMGRRRVSVVRDLPGDVLNAIFDA